jgi:Uncharacterized protein conserved in bacteria
MSEQKEYFSCPEEHGNIHISEDVLSVIAASAAMEVDGIAGLGNQASDSNDLRNPRTISKGIRIRLNEGEVTVDVAVKVKYGCVIPEVSKAVQASIESAVESMSGLKCESVNIHVVGIAFEKQTKKGK